ncbi:hypothetical protein GQ53DRAFT_805141 [Thozetella sp. PMI_491]|nr:hypothetical protein GQ53DRAFT_805141 [Thozetella sp. PMI_491]
MLARDRLPAVVHKAANQSSANMPLSDEAIIGLVALLVMILPAVRYGSKALHKWCLRLRGCIMTRRIPHVREGHMLPISRQDLHQVPFVLRSDNSKNIFEGIFVQDMRILLTLSEPNCSTLKDELLAANRTRLGNSGVIYGGPFLGPLRIMGSSNV